MIHKTNAIICDIDGVVLEMPYWHDLEDFYQNLDRCTPVDWAVKLVNGLHKQGIVILFVTARNQKCYYYTKYQLEQCFDFPIHLYMRGIMDLRDDPDMKRDYVLELKEKYNILFCIDDNPRNCEMYRELGLTALEVKSSL